jgi:hypothetical protein
MPKLSARANPKKSLKAKYKRIVLKLSGEALKAPGSQDNISPEIVQQICQQIQDVHEMGVEVAVVIGGGNIWRGLSASHRGMERTTADYMGMLATVINGLALQSAAPEMRSVDVCQSAVRLGHRIERQPERANLPAGRRPIGLIVMPRRRRLRPRLLDEYLIKIVADGAAAHQTAGDFRRRRLEDEGANIRVLRRKTVEHLKRRATVTGLCAQRAIDGDAHPRNPIHAEKPAQANRARRFELLDLTVGYQGSGSVSRARRRGTHSGKPIHPV